jgi:hypothetical protein
MGEIVLPQKNPIIEKCIGCNRVTKENDKEVCKTFPFPESKWRTGDCPMASHIVKEVVKEKQRVGQQKQQKIKHR